MVIRNLMLIFSFLLVCTYLNAQINNPLAVERNKLKRTTIVQDPEASPTPPIYQNDQSTATPPAIPAVVTTPPAAMPPAVAAPPVKKKEEAAPPKPEKKKRIPVLAWKDANYNFGTIDKGKPVTGVFEFRNITERPIFITHAKGSCGCTGVKYSEEPILPGETGKIIATYDAADIGPFKKSLTVITSADEEGDKTVLYLLGEVVWKF